MNPPGNHGLQAIISRDGHCRALYPAGVVTRVAMPSRAHCGLEPLRDWPRRDAFGEPFSLPQQRGISRACWLAGSGHRRGRVPEGPITHCLTSIRPVPPRRFTGQPLPVELVTLQALEPLDQQRLLTQVREVSNPLCLSL